MQQRDSQFDERDKAIQWVLVTVLLSFVITFLLAVFSFALAHLIGRGISQESMTIVGKFVKKCLFEPTYIFGRYFKWVKQFYNYNGPFRIELWLPCIPFFGFFVVLIVGVMTNPHSWLSTVHGDGRIAGYADIKKMGLFNGFIMVLGRWKGKLLKLPETLSVLVLAPPGTGKTVGVVMPTIFESEGISIIVSVKLFHCPTAEKMHRVARIGVISGITIEKNTRV